MIKNESFKKMLNYITWIYRKDSALMCHICNLGSHIATTWLLAQGKKLHLAKINHFKRVSSMSDDQVGEEGDRIKNCNCLLAIYKTLESVSTLNIGKFTVPYILFEPFSCAVPRPFEVIFFSKFM